MKYVNGLIERRQINGYRRRIDATANQAPDLGRNRIGCGGKVSDRRLVAKPRSHSAPKSLESYLNRVVQTVVACVIAPKRNSGASAIVLQQRDKRLGLAGIVRAKAKDVIAGDRERRCRAALANHKNIVSVRIRFDPGHLRDGLRSDHNPNSALIKVSNSVECLFRIELRIANKESESGWVILGADVFEVRCCNSQCGNGVFAKRRPRSG